jgi:hypothetical protein
MLGLIFGPIVDNWTAFYSDHAMMRTAIAFIHVGGLMIAGGCAITADLATIEAVREGPIGRSSQFHVLKRTHAIVVAGLIALTFSGLLLFAADAETFLHSKIFWAKMALLGTLLVNGLVMLRGERKVQSGDPRASRELHGVAVASLVLWLLTTLAGAALPNV